MFILLPPFTKEDGIETVLKRLTLEKFKEITQSSNQNARTVQLALPKFSLEHTLELVPVSNRFLVSFNGMLSFSCQILEQLGVGNLFQTDADFSVLTGKQELTLGEGIHKAKIHVDEAGTKAAGASSFFTWRMMWNTDDEPTIFKCNRPFLFFLYHKTMHTVLFIGAYKQP